MDYRFLLGVGKRTGIEAALFRNDFEPVEGERLAGGRLRNVP